MAQMPVSDFKDRAILPEHGVHMPEGTKYNVIHIDGYPYIQFMNEDGTPGEVVPFPSPPGWKDAMRKAKEDKEK